MAMSRSMPSRPTIEAAQPRAITVTPIPKLDHGNHVDSGPYPTPLARIPRVDETECVGCNLCSLVCPVEGCITMEEVDLGLPKESWEQRSAKHATFSVTNSGGR